MTRVVRLRTYADGPSAVDVGLCHVAVLDDGTEVDLLLDRGFHLSGPATLADVEETARVCVGPDEPVAGQTQASVERDHWLHLAAQLVRRGTTAPRDLAELPHEVVLSARLRARVQRWHVPPAPPAS